MPAKGGSKSASEGTGLPVPSQSQAGSPTEAGTAALRTSPESRFPIFYRSLTPIDAARHRGKSLIARLGFNFAKASHAVLLNGSEFEAAARHYPIVFTPAPTTSALCVLGVRPETNLFVDAKGDWPKPWPILRPMIEPQRHGEHGENHDPVTFNIASAGWSLRSKSGAGSPSPSSQCYSNDATFQNVSPWFITFPPLESALLSPGPPDRSLSDWRCCPWSGGGGSLAAPSRSPRR